ncbi:dihydrofolate reductase family protein [Rhodococcus sp. NPDC059968]|uniref:dihydrofolate reductase family protein n=1 Tax=Rhodococcus sp. NPDC059968 TaxID=3347017 RepID=UPI00366B3F8E
MRMIVLQMMTTLNGRLDDPAAWVHDVVDDQYREIDRIYSTYDTVLVGRTTYEEMAAYWPRALSEHAGTETNQVMAERMNTYRKLVFSRSGDHPLTEWANTEQVVVATDDELARYLVDLKRQPGKDIHLSGGSSFARSVVALGLVDEFYFFVYPVVSPGATWFSEISDQRGLELVGTESYGNGVVEVHYVPRERADAPRPESFTDLLA